MKNKSLKKILSSSDLSIGSWISFGFTQTCEMMARVKFDWLVIDMEHTSISNSECLNLIQIIENNNIFPIVRVGDNNPLLIKRALDAGAHGIIVPMVNNIDDAQRAFKSISYPPKGIRGVGLSRAQNYGASFEEYKKWADEEVVFIPQIEHFEAVNNLEYIIDLDYVDAIIVGPYDLSGSLGKPGNWDHPIVKKSLKKVNEILKKANKPFGFHVVHSDHKELKKRIDQGYRFIAYGDDMVFLAEKLSIESKFLSRLKNQ